MERREAPGSWAAPRERMLPPARASGAARATGRSLAEIACFGRAAPPGAPPRCPATAVDLPQLGNRLRPAARHAGWRNDRIYYHTSNKSQYNSDKSIGATSVLASTASISPAVRRVAKCQLRRFALKKQQRATIHGHSVRT